MHVSFCHAVSNDRTNTMQQPQAAGKVAMNKKATFVLVHGAWYGGWCWKKVVPCLTSAGCAVYTPTLSGFGERRHLVNAGTGLDTHIQDIISMIEFEGLNDVILVGHSYAGFVITGVADKIPGCISKVVYLDAMLPEDGKAMIDYLAPEIVRKYRDYLNASTNGLLVPFGAVATLKDHGVTDPMDVAWMTPRMTDLPYGAFTQQIRVSTALPQFINERGVYISTSDRPHFVVASKRAAARGLKLFVMTGAGHGCMVTQPAKLAEILLDIVSTPKYV